MMAQQPAAGEQAGVSSKLSLLLLTDYDKGYINKELDKIINVVDKNTFEERATFQLDEKKQGPVVSDAAMMAALNIGNLLEATLLMP